MIRGLGVAASILCVIALGSAIPASADGDDPFSDQTFQNLLSHDGLLFNFPLEKMQGQRFCESIIGGENFLQAVHDLQDRGSYSWDVANGITSAAGLSYCWCTDAAATGARVRPTVCSPFELRYGRHE